MHRRSASVITGFCFVGKSRSFDPGIGRKSLQEKSKQANKPVQYKSFAQVHLGGQSAIRPFSVEECR
jgi:hypothetical protein